MRARSSADTESVGGALGGFIGPVVFGSAAASPARARPRRRSSARDVTGSTLNQARDRTLQAASAVRSQRDDRRADRPPGRVGARPDRGRGQLQPLPRGHHRVLRGAAPLPGDAGARGRAGVPVRPLRAHAVHGGQGAALARAAARWPARTSFVPAASTRSTACAPTGSTPTSRSPGTPTRPSPTSTASCG